MRRVPALVWLALQWLLPLRAALAGPPLSVAEVVARAVRENPALAAAGAQLAEAGAALTAAHGLDDPVLSARAEARRTRREAVPGQPVQERALDALVAGVSLSQPLPSGGRLGVHAEGGYSYTRFETEAGLGPSRLASERYAPSLQLTFEQPLLRGAGVGVARADRWRARSARDVAQAEREALATALVREVVGAYWALAGAQAELEIRSASVSAARAQRAWVEAAIGVGKLPPSASAEVAVAIAEREDARLQAQQSFTERRLALVRAGALSLHEPAVVAALPALDTTTTPELAALLALALAHDPRLQALAEQAQRAALELGVTEDGLLPQLDLRVAGGPVGNAQNARGAYDQIAGLSSYALSAQLALELPIGRHAARGAYEAASARLQRARLSAADVRAQLEVAVASGLGALESAQQRCRLLTPSLEAAALDLEAEQARFEVGRGSSFDVLRRQDALARLRLLLVSAQLDVRLARVSLDAATGQLLGEHGIVMRGAWN